MSTLFAGSSRKWLLVLTGLTALRAVFASAAELCPDEAYYWTWSQQLAAGYYDHPPAVAFLIRLGTFLLGDNALGVRLGALVCGALTAWLIFVITRRLTGDENSAFWVALLASLSPILSAGSVIHTPDAALMLCWALACWLSLKTFERDRLVDWIPLGAVVGLACLSKGSGYLLLGSLGLLLSASKVGRMCLRGPGPAIGLMVAACVALPNLVWNAHHGGGSLLFQLEHATGGLAFRPLGLLEFLGGQAGVVSPLLWVGLVGFMAVAWRRSVRFGRSEAFVLWCYSGPVLLMTALLSTVHKVEANWSAMAYLSALPGMAWALTGGTWYLRRRRLWTTATLLVALVITALAHLQVLVPVLPLAPENDPTERLRGWKGLAEQAVADADALQADLASEGYGPVSALRFYTGRAVHHEASASRSSQYDLWPAKAVPERVLFLQPKTSGPAPRMCRAAVERWQLIRESEPGQASKLGRFRWWVCEGVGSMNDGEAGRGD